MVKNCAFQKPPLFWYSKRLLGSLGGCLLSPLSLLYLLVISIRRGLYNCGFLKTHTFPLPIIVVGNITVGGTGKTPFVIWLAKFLMEQGYRVGIVSRGYGKRKRGVCEVNSVSEPDAVGDEAVLIKRQTGCLMVVGEDRVSAVKKLIELSLKDIVGHDKGDCERDSKNKNIDIIISDDGLQHYSLGRDIEVVIVDEERGFGNGLCLPAGPLREPISRLKDVNFVVRNLSACNSKSKTDAKAVAPGSKGKYTMQFIPECFCAVKNSSVDADTLPLEIFRNKQVNAIAGIGNPAQFFQQLRDLELQVNEHVFPDHHFYSAADLDFFSGDERDKSLIMTEKDAVKCRVFVPSFLLNRKNNWWYLQIGVEISAIFKQDFMAEVKAKLLYFARS